MPYQIQEYNQLDDKLLNDWQRLWDQSPNAHFFNSPRWLLAWVRTFPLKDFKVAAFYDSKSLAAVLPLTAERKFGIKTLVFPGGKHLSKSALLTKNCGFPAMVGIMEYLLRTGSFYLSEISLKLADTALTAAPAVYRREASINPFFYLDKDPFGQQPKKRRKKAYRLIKSLRGHLSYRCFAGCRKAMEAAFAIDMESRKREQGKATFVNKADRDFFLHLVAAYKKQIVVCILFYDQVPIVFEIGFIYRNIYHVCNTAYLSDYAKLSPRRLLLYHTLHRLTKENLRVFDFSRGRNPLKDDFTSLSYIQYDLYWAKNPLVRYWWKAALALRQYILDNKLLYGAYLKGKGWWMRLAR